MCGVDLCFIIIYYKKGMVILSANVPAYYVEELSGILPTLVVYDSSSEGRDEFWWNLGHFCDAIASSHEQLEHLTMKSFMKDHVKKIIEITRSGGWLAEDSLYTPQPSRHKPCHVK